MNKNNFSKLNNGIPPTILTIFGATGDLSANYLIPSLVILYSEKLLPEDFKLVCVGRRDMTKESYLDFAIKKSNNLKTILNPQLKKSFLKHLIYFQGDFDSLESFKNLQHVLSEETKNGQHECFNRLYYFATSPEQFAKIAVILKKTNLLEACSGHGRQVRVLVEKPFGDNLHSAQKLNSLLLKFFKEEEIYRIDHYQGKETVQNLIVARFANSIFEPLWNKDYIDHIEISVLYDDTVGHRANFYDQTGALKDIVQNHALMMLSLLAMDEPTELTTENLRQEKFKVIQALKPFSVKDAKLNLVKGQYESYQQELGKKSQTETFVALKAFINNARWQGVPIYIRTGKALKNKVTELSIHFKELPKCLFKGCAANVMSFRIQPNESVRLQINNKIPGFGIELHQSSLNFSFGKEFKAKTASAYQRLLLDFMEGDQRLFIRSDEIEASWKFIDSITKAWKTTPLYKYKKGSEGPKEAEDFISKDLKEWWTK